MLEITFYVDVKSNIINCESEEDSDDEDEKIEINDANIEKIKPVLEKFKKAVDDFEELLGKYSLKCKDCDFEAKDANGLRMHLKAKHNK